MFESLRQWIRGLWEKFMITRDTIKQLFNVTPPESDAMVQAISLWSKMYENKSPWLGDDVVSLNLSAAIAAEITRITTIEAKCTVEGSPRGEFINEVMESVMDGVREQIERGIALGGSIIKPFVTKDGKLEVQFIHADSFVPLEFDSHGNITAVIFIEKAQVDDYWYTKLEHHSMVPGGCLVRNLCFKSTSETVLGSQVSLTAVSDWADIEPEATILGAEFPLFAYFRFPGANTVDSSSRLGASCYAKATDLIKEADELWSNFLWEMESGKRALYVDILAFKRTETGEVVLPNKRLYRLIDTGGAEEALFKDWSPTFRQEDILKALEAVLRRIEFQTGIAYGTLSDPSQVERTATEIATSKQRTYSTVVDTQKALQDSLERLIWAIDAWATILGLAPEGEYETSWEFDDSIVLDKSAQMTSDLALLGARLISRVEFRMRNFGETEEVAKKAIAVVDGEMEGNLDLTGGA